MSSSVRIGTLCVSSPSPCACYRPGQARSKLCSHVSKKNRHRTFCQMLCLFWRFLCFRLAHATHKKDQAPKFDFRRRNHSCSVQICPATHPNTTSLFHNSVVSTIRTQSNTTCHKLRSSARLFQIMPARVSPLRQTTLKPRLRLILIQKFVHRTKIQHIFPFTFPLCACKDRLPFSHYCGTAPYRTITPCRPLPHYHALLFLPHCHALPPLPHYHAFLPHHQSLPPLPHYTALPPSTAPPRLTASTSLSPLTPSTVPPRLTAL